MINRQAIFTVVVLASIIGVGCRSADPSRRRACSSEATKVSGETGWKVQQQIEEILTTRYPGYRQVAFLPPSSNGRAELLAERSHGVIQCGPRELVWWYEIVTAEKERKYAYFAVGPWLDYELYLVPEEASQPN